MRELSSLKLNITIFISGIMEDLVYFCTFKYTFQEILIKCIFSNLWAILYNIDIFFIFYVLMIPT